ncbi:hypothetical protein GCK72_014684 [Caenorhabditis remanei]|uniref:Uncharacterized protein n=1 Tax=Caenorhabditis remanei TaxID=31234 RepID=A0A6A5GUE8_CAERE|nr:hypothetical protein GCK72_014684 [Caenorhabditis remanei]KAF1758226.1 hypothetical protein GCK72_014684 [Caenorhabditis remanei]
MDTKEFDSIRYDELMNVGNDDDGSGRISRQRLTDPSTLSPSTHTVKDTAPYPIHITFWNRLQSPTLSHPAAHTIQPVASCPINVTLHN